MSKIISLFFIIILLFITIVNVNAGDKVKIISRSQWGANEQYRYWYSSEWKEIFKQNALNSLLENKKWSQYSQTKKNNLTATGKAKRLKTAKMNTYLSKNFYNDIQIVSSEKYEGKNKLAWPIFKTNSIKNIVIHHTESEYSNSYSGIKVIYKYHSLNKQWGDIGYHYVIGYNGEIFEGRTGGDYVVAAHDTWNNYSTVSIALMGNYQHKNLTKSQYNSLKNLISHLTKKYGINLNNKIPYHHECFGSSCKNGLQTQYFSPIVGHKDGKSTACPGETIYTKIIPQLLKELQPETSGYKAITLESITAQKKAYTTKINALNWAKIKQKISKFPPQTKLQLTTKLNSFLSYELNWKKEILYRKLLREIK